MEYKIEFTDKELTPWSGILMMIKMLEKMQFDTCLSKLDLLTQGSNRGYSPSQLIKQFMTSVWCGANKFEHTEVTRQDEVIRQFWNFKRMAGHKSFQRFFNKFDVSTNQRVFRDLYQWFFSHLRFDNFTLDVDSRIYTRYLFRQVVLNTKVHEQMKTLQYKGFAIGGYIIKNVNQRTLKLSLAMKRREWFTGLWMNTNNIKSPPVFIF